MKNMYEDAVIETTILDLAMLVGGRSGKKKISDIKSKMKGTDVWKIRFMGEKFDAHFLVDLLFKNGLDVFYVDRDAYVDFYICLIDEYRIHNTVVYYLRKGKRYE